MCCYAWLQNIPSAARYNEESVFTSSDLSRAILRSHSTSNIGQVHFTKLQETSLALSCTIYLFSLFPFFFNSTRSNRENCYSQAGCVQSLIRYPVWWWFPISGNCLLLSDIINGSYSTGRAVIYDDVEAAPSNYSIGKKGWKCHETTRSVRPS